MKNNSYMPSFQQFAASLIDSMLVLKNLSKRIQNEQDKKNQTNWCVFLIDWGRLIVQEKLEISKNYDLLNVWNICREICLFIFRIYLQKKLTLKFDKIWELYALFLCLKYWF